MTKIGRKGFMLAEVIVVSVVISTALIGLYVGLNKVSSAYDTRNRYYDIDSLYIAMEINDIIIKNNTLEGSGTWFEIVYIDKTTMQSSLTNDFVTLDNGKITNFQKFYKEETGSVITSYVTPYDDEMLQDLKNSFQSTTKSFKDYIDYLSGHLNFNEDYDYMIIVERMEDGNLNDCYYYALRLKYPY